MTKKAVILVSGGLDSATCIAIAKQQGFEIYALTVAYGQRHSVEVEFSQRVSEYFQVAEHRVFQLPLDQFGHSALTDHTIAVPDYTDEDTVPITYVPARNTIFLSLALAWAETLEAYDIMYGATAIDYSGYPDCRPEYIQAFETMANLATKDGIENHKFRIHAPLVALSKAEIIKRGISLGVDYAVTVSCYRPDKQGLACGSCDSCVYRKKGFQEAGINDPTRYSKHAVNV